VLSGITTVAAAAAEAGVELIAPTTCNLVCGLLVPIPTFWANELLKNKANALRENNSFFINGF
jgi:hypothetical protein